MAKHFQPDQKLKRLVKVYGVAGDVEVTLSVDGLRFRVVGSRKYTTSTWLTAVKHSTTDGDVAAHLNGDPVKFLIHEESKVGKRKAKRLDKQGA
jgi:hypothetical protein